jgi:hypothetical protein
VETVVGGMNIVFDPNEVKKFLIPVIAHKLKVLKRHNEHHYEIQWTHKTKRIYPDGLMTWARYPEQTVEHITDLPVH